MIVVDASVLAPALCDDAGDGDRARERLMAEEGLTAPEIVDLEVTSVWRRLTLTGSLPVRRAELALRDLKDLRMERIAHRHLLSRIWELRENLTTYDAAYVALAELLDVRLLTADTRIAGAPGVRCQVESLRS